jgi:hypothetical protein
VPQPSGLKNSIETMTNSGKIIFGIWHNRQGEGKNLKKHVREVEQPRNENGNVDHLD